MGQNLDDTVSIFFLPAAYVHTCLPQNLTEVKRLVIALSHCIVHVVDVYSYKMMNPSSDVYKKCLIEGHLPTKRCWGAVARYFVFQVDNISSDHSIFFHLVMVRLGHSKLYWIGGIAFMRMSCDSSHCCVSAYQQWLSSCSGSCFCWHKCEPWVPLLHSSKAVGFQSLIGIMPQSLLGCSLVWHELYHGVLMLCSLSCA